MVPNITEKTPCLLGNLRKAYYITVLELLLFFENKCYALVFAPFSVLKCKWVTHWVIQCVSEV